MYFLTFLNPNIFLQFEFVLFQFIRYYEKTPGTILNSILLPKIYLKIFANSRPSVSNFKSFSRSLQQIFSHSFWKQFWYQNTIFSGKSQREFEPSTNARWGSNGAKGQSLPSSANNYQKWGGIEKIVPKMWIRPRKTQTATDPYYEYPSKYNLSYISCVNGKSLG